MKRLPLPGTPRACAIFVIGALEEAASGTNAAALALYLAHHHACAERDPAVEQGIEVQRPRRLDVSVESLRILIVRGDSKKLLSRTVNP